MSGQDMTGYDMIISTTITINEYQEYNIMNNQIQNWYSVHF